MRWSKYFLQTIREVPGDADAVSHVLLARAGMIRRIAAGIYALTPLGLRSHRKTETIVREEMDRAGCLELELPILQPRELWEESGRWERYSAEQILFHLKDRKDGEYCLAPTAEEAVTAVVRAGVTSYRQLPMTLYQIRSKFRDEIRPRFGLMRGREFLMYDGYSFDADSEGLDRSYRAQDAAYRRVFERCGLDFTVVEADSGAIGGSASQEFMVLADTGEDAVARCAACGYGANIEKAETARRPAPWDGETAGALEDVETPGLGGIDEVVEFLGITASRMVKCLVYETDKGYVVALVRGDLDANEVALKNALGVERLALASEEKIEGAAGAPVGFVGPHHLAGRNLRIVADESVRGAVNAVTGAGRRDWHVRNLSLERDGGETEFLSFAAARAGDPCPRCGEPLSIARGIEVGHIFKLGTKYSIALRCEFTDEKGETRPAVMGTYGIGVGRTMAAAVEQHHDGDGIVWPLALAPFEIAIVSLNPSDEAARQAADTLYESLAATGHDVFYDDRDERPGVKFKDADLVGFPIRVNVGGRALKEGKVEIVSRRDKSVRAVPLAEASEAVAALRKELAGAA
ncbi:MAG: proline--tRNA ligase [Acidobacteriota bacterium]|nr:proline--tRNA ligase [Acidobacteriota bacterium]MDQ5870822.1 proline--tRNA ligase [Acidobacteriota bacterium]